eukprot:scaffold180_cov311-Pinguiococcus_pyrenoidosus.AAC.45
MNVTGPANEPFLAGLCSQVRDPRPFRRPQEARLKMWRSIRQPLQSRHEGTNAMPLSAAAPCAANAGTGDGPAAICELQGPLALRRMNKAVSHAGDHPAATVAHEQGC